MARHYEWRRFWFDRDGPQAPVDGYLTRPDDLALLLTGEEAVELAGLAAEPCLVLLGEPGLGKTSSVRQAARELETSVDSEEVVQRLNLAGHDNATLRAKLFEADPWRAWLDEGRTLHLFLDSFDETLPRDTSFHRLLIEELEEAGSAISRLRLRIVCRSAEWIPKLGDDLQRLFAPSYPAWTGPLPRQMILAQLRSADVWLAAEVEGLDPAAFLGDIADLGLQGMAAVPLTLEMLIEDAKERGGLPVTRAELFGRAALRLAGEHDREQRYSEERAQLSAGERLAIAQRVAAAALLSGRTTIGTESSAVAVGELRPAEVAGRSEEDPLAGRGASFEVKEKHILEVLRTALFVDVGPDRVRFRHRSLAEFLAASYLVRRKLDRVQLMSLLGAPGDEEGCLIPQLREVAAWAAAMDPEALAELLEREPATVLRADRLRLSPEQAARAAEALLTPDVARTIEPWDQRLAHSLRAVDHPRLAAILRGPLGDGAAPEPVRKVAVTLARACERRDLEPELLGLVLDPEASPTLRTHAAWAIEEFGSEEARHTLIPLTKTMIDGDRFEQLKGAAFSAVFPSCLDLEETLAAITEPREPAPRSSYVIFLRRILPQRITLEDLPTALCWAAGVQPRLGDPDEFNRLVDAILTKAWSRLHDPAIVGLVAAVVRERLELGAEPYGRLRPEGEEFFFGDESGKHALLCHLINSIADGEAGEMDRRIVNRLLRDGDLGWVLDRLEAEIGGQQEATWAALAAGFAEIREPELERLFDLSERSQKLDANIEGRFDAVPWASEHSRILREIHERESAEKARPAPAMDGKVEKALARFERGDLDAWLQLNEAMRFGPPGANQDASENEGNLTELPGWERAGVLTRERIATAAVSFLERGAPDIEGERGPGSRTFAGYRALFLLAAQPVRLSGLSGSAWARWAPLVFDFPPKPMNGEEEQLCARLFEAAAAGAPAELVGWASEEADRVLKAGGNVSYALRGLRDFPDPRLVEALLPKLSDETASPDALASLLEWALGRAPEEAAKRVEPRLTAEAIAAGPDGRVRAEKVAAVLLKQAPASGWPIVKRFLTEDEQLGIDVLLEAGLGPSIDTTGLAAPQLVELVAMVFDLFPPDRDLVPDQDPTIDSEDREGAIRMRGHLLLALAERGADEAVSLIEELHDRYPDAVSRGVVREALEARRARWLVLEPGQIVELCHANTARLVFDDLGLQEAVLGSLSRIRLSLREGEPPLARELWNLEARRPESEDALSNWLARALEVDMQMAGRVLNREVQIESSASGKGVGPRVDIKVTAPTGKFVEEAGVATVLIEVKGAWNKETKSGMRNQLAERYLLRSGHRHGVYVVFWFSPDEWTSADTRASWDGRMELVEAERLFERQAEDLSGAGDVAVRAFVIDGSL